MPSERGIAEQTSLRCGPACAFPVNKSVSDGHPQSPEPGCVEENRNSFICMKPVAWRPPRAPCLYAAPSRSKMGWSGWWGGW